MIFKLAALIGKRRAKLDRQRQAREVNAICRAYEDTSNAMNLGDLLVMTRYMIQDRRHEVSARDLQDYGNAICRVGDIAEMEQSQ